MSLDVEFVNCYYGVATTEKQATILLTDPPVYLSNEVWDEKTGYFSLDPIVIQSFFKFLTGRGVLSLIPNSLDDLKTEVRFRSWNPEYFPKNIKGGRLSFKRKMWEWSTNFKLPKDSICILDCSNTTGDYIFYTPSLSSQDVNFNLQTGNTKNTFSGFYQAYERFICGKEFLDLKEFILKYSLLRLVLKDSRRVSPFSASNQPCFDLSPYLVDIPFHNLDNANQSLVVFCAMFLNFLRERKQALSLCGLPEDYFKNIYWVTTQSNFSMNILGGLL